MNVQALASHSHPTCRATSSRKIAGSRLPTRKQGPSSARRSGVLRVMVSFSDSTLHDMRLSRYLPVQAFSRMRSASRRKALQHHQRHVLKGACVGCSPQPPWKLQLCKSSSKRIPWKKASKTTALKGLTASTTTTQNKATLDISFSCHHVRATHVRQS